MIHITEFPKLTVLAPDGTQGAKFKVAINNPDEEARLAHELGSIPKDMQNANGVKKAIQNAGLMRADT